MNHPSSASKLTPTEQLGEKITLPTSIIRTEIETLRIVVDRKLFFHAAECHRPQLSAPQSISCSAHTCLLCMLKKRWSISRKQNTFSTRPYFLQGTAWMPASLLHLKPKWSVTHDGRRLRICKYLKKKKRKKESALRIRQMGNDCIYFFFFMFCWLFFTVF